MLLVYSISPGVFSIEVSGWYLRLHFRGDVIPVGAEVTAVYFAFLSGLVKTCGGLGGIVCNVTDTPGSTLHCVMPDGVSLSGVHITDFPNLPRV